jgi:excinuclease ABC subunit B
VLLYGDRVTDAMRRAMEETARRRTRQAAFNHEHGIEPRTILKEIHNPLVALSNLDYHDSGRPLADSVAEDEAIPLADRISRLEKEMRAAAKRLEFEEAAALRDRIRELRELQVFRS